MELQRLTRLADINIGDIFTMIEGNTNADDNVIQFIGRDPKIKSEKFSKESGYFTTVYGPKKCFILYNRDLSGTTEYYIGYDEEFVLKRRIERIFTYLSSLQDRLVQLKNRKS